MTIRPEDKKIKLKDESTVSNALAIVKKVPNLIEF